MLDPINILDSIEFYGALEFLSARERKRAKANRDALYLDESTTYNTQGQFRPPEMVYHYDDEPSKRGFHYTIFDVYGEGRWVFILERDFASAARTLLDTSGDVAVVRREYHPNAGVIVDAAEAFGGTTQVPLVSNVFVVGVHVRHLAMYGPVYVTEAEHQPPSHSSQGYHQGTEEYYHDQYYDQHHGSSYKPRASCRVKKSRRINT